MCSCLLRTRRGNLSTISYVSDGQDNGSEGDTPRENIGTFTVETYQMMTGIDFCLFRENDLTRYGSNVSVFMQVIG